MIGYVTLGTNSLEKAGTFYDALLALFGAKRAYTLERMIAWSADPTKPMLVVTQPSDGKPAKPGNGVMLAFICRDADHVRSVHAKALDLGAENTGSPETYDEQFFGGYFRDLDGNKVCAFVMA